MLLLLLIHHCSKITAQNRVLNKKIIYLYKVKIVMSVQKFNEQLSQGHKYEKESLEYLEYDTGKHM